VHWDDGEDRQTARTDNEGIETIGVSDESGTKTKLMGAAPNAKKLLVFVIRLGFEYTRTHSPPSSPPSRFGVASR
jgi:hypothetical protein